jgi:predicted amidohydrolase
LPPIRLPFYPVAPWKLSNSFAIASNGVRLKGSISSVVPRPCDNEVMIVRADVAGRTADRISFGSSAIVDARGTVLRTGEALSEDILVAELHARGRPS